MYKNTVLHLLLLLFVISDGYGLNHNDNLITRVFDGQKLNREKNKHLVKLEITFITYYSYWPRITTTSCSGSIISERWILTAAHCLSNSTDSITVWHQGRRGMRQIAAGAKIIVNPGYIADTQDPEKDIALVATKKLIQFTAYVQPIPLAKQSVTIGKAAMISGFGEMRPFVSGPRQGVVRITRCPYGLNSNLILCSKTVVRAGSGDSGGSLVYKGELVGITSKSCKNVYISNPCLTVYVDVPANLGWIETITGSS